VWGAAPQSFHRLLPLAVVAAVFAVSPAPTQARVGAGAQVNTPSQVWGLGLDRRSIHHVGDGLASRARSAGMNTLLVDGRGLGKRQWRKVRHLAKRYGFRQIVLPRRSTTSVRRAEAACAKARRKHPNAPCTLRAASLASARMLAASSQVDLVVVRLKRLPSPASTQTTGALATVVELVEIGHGSLDQRAWSEAVGQAAANPTLDLAVAPSGGNGSKALNSFTRVLSASSSRTAPPPPSGLTVTDRSLSSVGLGWNRVNGAVTYNVYLGVRLVMSPRKTQATLTGLTCS